MAARLDVLDADRQEADALRGLMRGFHGLAGSGALYGFPLVTTLARKAEHECLARMQAEQPPAPEELTRWRSVLTNLRRELSGAPGPAPALPGATAPGARVAGAQVAGARTADAERAEALIVEHDSERLAALVALTEGESLRVRLARTRAAAVDAIEHRLPEALILDLALPDGSGYELIEHLRSYPSARGAAILALSDETGLLPRVEALRCGADACLPLPLGESAFLRQLRRLMNEDPTQPGRVLVVSGTPSNAEACAEVLGEAGYVVAACRDPAELEAAVVDHAPELLLVEARLQGLDGADLVRHLRQDERHVALPALVVGATEALDARLEVARAGADGLLQAPVDPELLLTAVASRIARARQLRDCITRDGLTGVATRQVLLEQARSVVAQRQRAPERGQAWVAIDIDDLRGINRSHGYHVGDRVLMALAALLRDQLREGDRIARYDGDEFAVLLADLEKDDAARLTSRLLEAFVELEHGSEGASLSASFSAGVAWLEEGMSREAWCRAAHDALSRAQADGGRRVVEHG
jgi:diguanylate cyclase (GGDEF)-like protein